MSCALGKNHNKYTPKQLAWSERQDMKHEVKSGLLCCNILVLLLELWKSVLSLHGDYLKAAG